MPAVPPSLGPVAQLTNREPENEVLATNHLVLETTVFSAVRLVGYLLVAVVAAMAGAGAMHIAARASAPDDLSLSFDSVRQLSPQQVADRILPPLTQHLAENVVGVQFDGSIPHGGTAMSVDHVQLRMRAKGAGWRAICVADNLGMDLEPSPRRSGAAAATVKPSGSFQLRQNYRIIGDTAPDEAWTDAYKVELDRACGTLGPEAVFFSVSRAVDLRTIADMLPALKSVAESTDALGDSIHCTGDQEACRDPRAILQALRPDQIISADSLIDCGARETCLELAFLAGQRRHPVELAPPPVWIVRARGVYRGTYQTGWGKIAISSLELSYQ